MKNISRYLWNELMYFMQNNTKNSAEYAIALELVNRFEEISQMKIEEIAHNANVTPSTVSKFCKKLGFEGYNDLKACLPDIPFNDSKIAHIRESYPREQYMDAFLIYDSQLTTLILNNIGKNLNAQKLSQDIIETKSVCIISPDYASSAAVIFIKTCNCEGIDCFKIARKSDHDFIIKLTKSCSVVIVISTTGEWIEENSDLIDVLKHQDNQIYVVGSSTILHTQDESDTLIPIVLGEELTVLDSHYNSSRFYTLFFAYLSLSI